MRDEIRESWWTIHTFWLVFTFLHLKMWGNRFTLTSFTCNLHTQRLCKLPAGWCCDCTNALATIGRTFISVAVLRQSLSSRSISLHPLLITELHSADDAGWRGTSHDRICNCLHNAKQVEVSVSDAKAQILHEASAVLTVRWWRQHRGRRSKTVNVIHKSKSRESVWLETV